MLYDLVSVITSEIRKAKTAANTSQRTAVGKIEIKASEHLLKELENIANVQVPPMEMGQGGDYMTPDMEMTQM